MSRTTHFVDTADLLSKRTRRSAVSAFGSSQFRKLPEQSNCASGLPMVLSTGCSLLPDHAHRPLSKSQVLAAQISDRLATHQFHIAFDF